MAVQFDKFIFFIQSEGVRTTLRYVSNSIIRRIGLRLSETYFFRLSLNNGYDIIRRPSLPTKWPDIRFTLISGKQDFAKYGSVTGRINFLPTDNWFSRGSVCFALTLDRNVVAYSWVHYDLYDNLGLAGTFNLNNCEVFTGPDYTDPLYRQKGLSYVLMYEKTHYLLRQGIQTVYTATNIRNIAPIKYYIRSGFQVIGCVRARRYAGKQIIDFTQDQLLTKKLQ